MKIEELVKKFEIFEKDGKIGTYKAPDNPEERASLLDEMRRNKAEILDYIRSEKEKLRAEFERKEQIFNSIPGVVEIQNARNEYYQWHYEFNKAMESEDGAGVFRACPPNPGEIEEQYPDAVFALEMKRQKNSANYEIASYTGKAYEMLRDGQPIDVVKAYYEAENKAFIERHMWD